MILSIIHWKIAPIIKHVAIPNACDSIKPNAKVKKADSSSGIIFPFTDAATHFSASLVIKFETDVGLLEF